MNKKAYTTPTISRQQPGQEEATVSHASPDLRLRRQERLDVHGRAAARTPRQTQGLRRQFRLQPDRPLDALTTVHRPPSGAVAWYLQLGRP